MKRLFLMTGIKYACEGGACLKKTLEHLDDVKPEVLIVKTMTEKFGVVLKVLEPIDNAEDDDMETTEKRGVISRVDLMDMLHLMEVSGYDVIAGKVAYVSKLGHALIEVDVLDDFMVCGADGIDAWHDWNWVNAMAEEGVIDYEMFSEAQEAIMMLDLALEQPGALSDTMTVKCIRKLIKVSRFDVSMETQRALARYRQLVPQHPSEKVKAMTDALVKAINDIGSKERMMAFRDEYFPQVKARLDARRKELERHSPSDRDALRQSAYEALRRLPDNLFYDISDKGEMMHRLLYIGNGIPRRKLLMLLDAVSVWEGQTEEKVGDESVQFDVPSLPQMVRDDISESAELNFMFRQALADIAEKTSKRGMIWKWSHVKKVLEDLEFVSQENPTEFGKQMHQILEASSAGSIRKSVENHSIDKMVGAVKYWELEDRNPVKKILLAIGARFQSLREKMKA